MNAFHNTLVLAQDGIGLEMMLALVAVGASAIGLVGLAQTFAKAGKSRLGAVIPIYNALVLLDIAKRPRWWFFLTLLPGINVVVSVVVAIDIAKAFGKGTGFGWGLVFLGAIFFPILGFGDAVYLPNAVHDPKDPASPAEYIARINTATKKQFARLGVSLVSNYPGRGATVAFGRGSKVGPDDLPALIPIGINELYLSRTSIGDESLPQFEAMRHLRVLDLSHTKVSRDGIQQLKGSLPQAQIIG